MEPSLYAADFSRLGEQIETLMRAGARIFHFDVGDGHFVPPITIGPIVLQSIAPLVHRLGGRLDCHLMVEEPQRHFEAIAEAGGDSVTFHIEAVRNPAAVARLARQHELQVGLAFKPETEPEQAADVAEPFDLVLCMSIEPGYSGQPFMPEALPRIERLRGLLPAEQADPGRRRGRPGQHPAPPRRGREPVRRRHEHLRARRHRSGLQGTRSRGRVNEHLARALELAEQGRGTTHPNPVVGAVVVRDDEVVGEGWHRRKGEPHAEVLALDQAGERAAGSTVYLTMEPCAHHGTMPPCTDALVAADVKRVVAASLDPNPEAGGGLELLRAAGVEVQHADLFAARAQNEAWRTWVAQGRPFVTYKAAMTLDGRLTIPGERWISGEESRRLVHELRAGSDAVAVGMGTVHADRPSLDARDVGAVRQPRRLAFGRAPLPEGCDLELRTGSLSDELAALGADGVQSLLLEGGPRIAAAFLREGLLDKLLVFVAPRLAGEGPAVFEGGTPPLRLSGFASRPAGEDVLLTGYVNEP